MRKTNNSNSYSECECECEWQAFEALKSLESVVLQKQSIFSDLNLKEEEQRNHMLSIVL